MSTAHLSLADLRTKRDEAIVAKQNASSEFVAEQLAADVNHWQALIEARTPDVQYAYAPIPYFNGAVLKCQGIFSGTNMAAILFRQDFTEADVVIVDGYIGDRIFADDRTPYNPTLEAARNTVAYYEATDADRICLVDNLNPCGGLTHWSGIGKGCPLCSANAALRHP